MCIQLKYSSSKAVKNILYIYFNTIIFNFKCSHLNNLNGNESNSNANPCVTYNKQVTVITHIIPFSEINIHKGIPFFKIWNFLSFLKKIQRNFVKQSNLI